MTRAAAGGAAARAAAGAAGALPSGLARAECTTHCRPAPWCPTPMVPHRPAPWPGLHQGCIPPASMAPTCRPRASNSHPGHRPHAGQRRAAACLAGTHHTMPHHTTPCHITPCHTTPCHTTPCHIKMVHHPTLNYATLHYATPHHTTPCCPTGCVGYSPQAAPRPPATPGPVPLAGHAAPGGGPAV